MDYLVSCNHLVKIVKVYMLPFCGEIKMNKTKEMGLLHGRNFKILTSTIFLLFTRVTDGRAIAYSVLSILYAIAICCRALKMTMTK